jgi:Arm domain-containing DNA-binding protein
MARREKSGSWGGRRKGAGRKPKLTLPSQQKIASDYYARMQEARELGDTPRRDAVIDGLIAQNHATPRMVKRYLDRWLAPTRWNIKMYRYATEAAPIQWLPKEGIEKLSPGTYVDKRNRRLRLIIDRAGSRKWMFRFEWGFAICDMPLRDPADEEGKGAASEISLTMARELATKASRELAAGQNPIDGSWASARLQSAKSKS